MTDYSELKRLAEAAKLHANDSFALPSSLAFERAANPAAVLALIAENEDLRLELSGVETAKRDLAEVLDCADEPRWKWLYCNASSLRDERDHLKAEVEALRKDAERYRWASKNLVDLGTWTDSDIDAAMRKE